jgi:hypothetical protein
MATVTTKNSVPRGKPYGFKFGLVCNWTAAIAIFVVDMCSLPFRLASEVLLTLLLEDKGVDGVGGARVATLRSMCTIWPTMYRVLPIGNPCSWKRAIDSVDR